MLPSNAVLFRVSAPCHHCGSLSCSLLRSVLLREKAARFQVSFVSAFIETDTEMLAIQRWGFERIKTPCLLFQPCFPEILNRDPWTQA